MAKWPSGFHPRSDGFGVKTQFGVASYPGQSQPKTLLPVLKDVCTRYYNSLKLAFAEGHCDSAQCAKEGSESNWRSPGLRKLRETLNTPNLQQFMGDLSTKIGVQGLVRPFLSMKSLSWASSLE